MSDPLEYVTKGALMQCDKGTIPSLYNPAYNATVKVQGLLASTEMDRFGMANIPTFGVCAMSGGPCVPALAMWQDLYPAKIKGAKTVLVRTCGRCSLGGKIEFLTSGQIPIEEPIDRPVGETGFVEGLIPIWGSGRDMINAIQTGDTLGAVMNAGFLVWDVVSIAAGAVSFGAGTALMQGAKVGAKALLKNAAKQVAKTFTREGAAKLLAKIGEKICVTACFPAGTLIDTEHGLLPIENIKMGDTVWAMNEKTGEYALRQVLFTQERVTDFIIEIKLQDEIIRTTPEHPFWVNDDWKLAGELEIGNLLLSQEDELIAIESVEHLAEETRVYNFEVEGKGWHNYFVSKLKIWVHNASWKTLCLSNIMKHLPEWLRKMWKGNYFNEIRGAFYKRMGGFNEVVLETGKRLDSYIPGKEIVSRKLTQLAEVTEKTAKGYIDEMVSKYSPGTKILDSARNAEAIAKSGPKLAGDMILEVPKQVGEISKEVLQHAKDNLVKIRDVFGNILNP